MSIEIPEGIIRIIIGLVALVVGWVIGFFDSKLRADKKIKQAEEKSELAIQQAKGEAERAVMMARSAAESVKPTTPGNTLLRLWLDAAKRPALDLDGLTVSTDPIAEPNRKRLLSLISAMRPWIEGKAGVVPVPAIRPTIPTAVPIPSTPTPGDVTPAPLPAAVATKDEKSVKPLSIVEQIDEILQARLAASPLAGRGIRLQEAPGGGVIVWVGMKKFEGVNDVTDPEVQAIIRAATAEWERKYTPGI